MERMYFVPYQYGFNFHWAQPSPGSNRVSYVVLTIPGESIDGEVAPSLSKGLLR
jgi:hypothetical protein